jgi:nucleoside-diphosphate-sugar epimerase
MIYVDDLVSAILYLLQDSSRNSAVFELDDGHESGYSWDDVAAEAARKLGRGIRTFAVPAPILRLMGASASLISSLTNQPLILSRGKINEFTHPDWVATTNLLSEINGWKANVNLRDGISETIDWYVSQGWL